MLVGVPTDGGGQNLSSDKSLRAEISRVHTRLAAGKAETWDRLGIRAGWLSEPPAWERETE